MSQRWDETWHRLREWTNGQAQAERLAAQILLAEKFTNLDPSHPLGGKDGGKDAMCMRNGAAWVMAVYFPRGQQDFRVIRNKFENDLTGARVNGVAGIAFVTNQELRLAEREDLKRCGQNMEVELYHLERLAAILDQPAMASVRQQFVGVGAETDHGPGAVDKWVGTGYVERSGIGRLLEEQGFRAVWVDADHENDRLEFEGWEYVEVEESDGKLARLKIRDVSAVGGYLVLLKKQQNSS